MQVNQIPDELIAALDSLDEELTSLEDAQAKHEEVVDETADGELDGEPLDVDEVLDACAESEAKVDDEKSHVERFCVELRQVIDDLELNPDELRNYEGWRGQHPIAKLIEEMEERV